MINVSVIVPSFNRSHSIQKCINALLSQTVKDYEIIIADDGSTDNTVDTIRKIKNSKLKLILSSQNGGPAAARNLAIKQAKGEYIFFTDDDVIVPNDWIESGLKYFSDEQVAVVEGRIIYVNSLYKAVYSDRIVENSNGGFYMTANMAYRRRDLLKTQLFDESLRVFEDRKLALQTENYGKIVFGKTFVVHHQQESYTVRTYMKEAKKAAIWLDYNSVIQENDRLIFGKIYEPLKLLTLFIPILILARFFKVRLISKKDWTMFFLMYPRLWYERFLVWQWAYQHKVVII